MNITWRQQLFFGPRTDRLCFDDARDEPAEAVGPRKDDAKWQNESSTDRLIPPPLVCGYLGEPCWDEQRQRDPELSVRRHLTRCTTDDSTFSTVW